MNTNRNSTIRAFTPVSEVAAGILPAVEPGFPARRRKSGGRPAPLEILEAEHDPQPGPGGKDAALYGRQGCLPLPGWRRGASSKPGFTLIELIVVLGVIVLLAFVLIPSAMKARQKAQRIRCVSHLKQIGLSFRLWSGDSEAYYPMARSTNNNQGTLEVANDVWRTFQVMSNELSTPVILACQSDSRDPAADFSSLANSNISYFIGIDANDSMPELLLAGDRHLSTGRPTQNKILTIRTNDTAGWVSSTHVGAGNVALADGSVQQFTSARLHQAVTNLFQTYRRELTNATLRIAMPE